MSKFSRDFDHKFFIYFYGRDESSQLSYGSSYIIAYIFCFWVGLGKMNKR